MESFNIELDKIFDIKVIAHASKNEITLDKGCIKVKVTSIPENNMANNAIINLFSHKFKIPKCRIDIVKGHKSNKKSMIIKSPQNKSSALR